jgi:hypothetical protein
MKRLMLVLLSVIVLAVPMAIQAQDVSGGSIEEIASSVVLIETIRGIRAISSGTGTIISPDGLIYTNQHVIEDGNDFAIYLLGEDLGEQPDLRYYASLLYVSRSLDFAILEIDRDANGNAINASNESLPYLPPTHVEDVSIGDTIRIFGYPGIGDGYMIVTSGEIVAVQNGTINGQRVPVWYRTDAEISGGNSGGLAVNQNGEFIGLPTWVVSEERTAGRLGGILPIGAIEMSLETRPPQLDSADGSNADGSLRVINDSDVAICSAFISPTTSDSWGANQLSGQILGGAQFVWEFPDGAYDILLRDCSDNTLEDFRNVIVAGVTTFTYNPDESTYSSDDGGSIVIPDDDGVITLSITNNAPEAICYVYFSLTTSDSWGEPRLGATEFIRRGDTSTWEVDPGNYDVLMQDCAEETLEDLRNINLTTSSVEITYP